MALNACATTGVQSFVDPAYSQTRYDGFIAYAAFSDLGIEAAFERALCQRLLAAGHACTTMLAAAPPTRDQDAASRHAASRNSGAQATIVIELADADNAARRQLSDGGPAYRISVIDNNAQTVIARLAAHSSEGQRATAVLAHSLADAVVESLAKRSLLYERP